MVQKYVNTFWDTDFESDVEGAPATRKEDFKENNGSGKHKSTSRLLQED